MVDAVALAEKRARLAALYRLHDGAEPFRAFVARVAPQYAVVPDHLAPLYDLIQRSRHEPVRALVSMPPRTGKSTTLKLGLAYRALYDPACQNFYATYAGDFAEETGREVRNLARACGVQIGRTIGYAPKGGTGKVIDWKTSYGGGLKSTSIGGQITGRGANGGIIVIDDPIKGADIAHSLTERNRVWRWLKSDVLSRAEGGASVILVQTRWHEDDPIGRMLEDGLGEVWQHINLPAMHDGFGNPIDEKLRPDIATPLWLDVDSMHPGDRDAAMKWYAICRARGEYEWWSLYQGVPRSESRKMFGDDPTLFELPLRYQGKRAMLMLDPAATARTSANYSAIGAFAMEHFGDATEMYTVEAAKYQVSIPEVARVAMRWHARYKWPVGVECVGAFVAVPQIIRETAPGIKLIEIPAIKDKYTRAIPASKAWQSGRWHVPKQTRDNGAPVPGTEWVDDYVRVMQSFTGVGDAEDDLVDISAHAWNRMYKEKPNTGQSRSQDSRGY